MFIVNVPYGDFGRFLMLLTSRKIIIKYQINIANLHLIFQEFCDAIGADYYTDDAATASDVAKAILEGKE